MTLQKDGPWPKTSSRFRDLVPSQQYPAERDRYILYVNYCCPWSHRTIITLGLKGLGDVVQLVEADAQDVTHGWWFSGRRGPDRDPVNGVKYIKELYLRADPQYNGRVTVPMLWDKKNGKPSSHGLSTPSSRSSYSLSLLVLTLVASNTYSGTIVNNESSDIIRILFEAFDDFLPLEKQEANKGKSAFIPSHLRDEIDSLNAWVYEGVNNGVYKTGFASSQLSYESNIAKLFKSLDRLEHHLSEDGHHPYLFGDFITEADIRLYTTMIRFDIVYYTLFKCNVKMIRADYPRLHAWLRRLYWSEGPETAGGVFKKTTLFDTVSPHRA
jgi:putative glutathione S-transferase